MKVLAFGEVLWDFIAGNKFFGGAPVNFAAHVVQRGAKAGIATWVQSDWETGIGYFISILTGSADDRETMGSRFGY